jgi:hypothetical protein
MALPQVVNRVSCRPVFTSMSEGSRFEQRVGDTAHRRRNNDCAFRIRRNDPGRMADRIGVSEPHATEFVYRY